MHALLTAEAVASNKNAIRRSSSDRRAMPKHSLAWLTLLALGLRVVAAAQPGFHHPDAIYQYLEPAFRLLTGQGVVTWEWRVGMRSWLLPALLAGPVALGEAIDARSTLPLVLPRIAMALGSLGIVWAAWQHGRRHAELTGLLAGFVAATWFEFIYFGSQTLAEPLATAAFLIASVPLTKPDPSARAGRAAGALLAAMVLLRPHYAPAGLVLVGFASWPLRRNPRTLMTIAWPVIVGGIAMAAIAAAIDSWAGGVPFAWIVENARQNIVEHVAARYGVAPPLAFVAWLLALWQWWIIPIAIGVRFGWRYAPALVAVALVTIVLHSLIGHKEYRFIFLATASLVIVAAIGWGDILARARRSWPDRRAAVVTTAVFAAWGLALITLAFGAEAKDQRSFGVIGSHLVATLRADPAVCGMAIVYGAAYADLPGQVGLGRDIPQYMFWSDRAAHRGSQSWAQVARDGAEFNRIIGSVPRSGRPPQGYHTVRCETDRDGFGLCLYARAGSCSPRPNSPYGMNRMLTAHGA